MALGLLSIEYIAGAAGRLKCGENRPMNQYEQKFTAEPDGGRQ